MRRGSGSNGRFAVTADPTNEKLKERLAEVEKKTEQGIPTVPTTVGEELETNPFVRAGTVEVAEAMGLAGESPEKVLAEVRRRKDSF